MTAVLYGNNCSVYTRAVRMVLDIKGAAYRMEEVDPFDPKSADSLLDLHPFARVPVFELDGFVIYETQAILDYLDVMHDDPILTPDEPRAIARMRQVMTIADNYFYWPLVQDAPTAAKA